MANVLVLGATSAVAAEAAAIYAARGDRLHLVGRDPAKLAAVAARCPGATTARADLVTADPESVVRDAIAALGPIDVALLAYGDLGDQLASEASVDEALRILRVDFTSAVGLLVPLANHLEARKAGRIGVIGSVAGDRGRPRNYTYGAAKAGLTTYLQGLRSRLYPAGVTVTTIKLGPVDTPMTATHAKSALFSRPEPVARAIVRAIDRGAREPYVPGWWFVVMAVVRSLPEWLFQRIGALSAR
jgi:short-subunit dehydrogenase